MLRQHHFCNRAAQDIIWWVDLLINFINIQVLTIYKNLSYGTVNMRWSRKTVIYCTCSTAIIPFSGKQCYKVLWVSKPVQGKIFQDSEALLMIWPCLTSLFRSLNNYGDHFKSKYRGRKGSVEQDKVNRVFKWIQLLSLPCASLFKHLINDVRMWDFTSTLCLNQ